MWEAEIEITARKTCEMESHPKIWDQVLGEAY
jgi:hypothetical protein